MVERAVRQEGHGHPQGDGKQTIRRRRLLDHPIGKILAAQQLISQDDLEAILAQQSRTGKRFGQLLMERRLETDPATIETWILRVLQDQYGFPHLPLESLDIDFDLLQLIPEAVARDGQVFPVSHISFSLTVAMADPLDGKLICWIEQLSDCVVQSVISTPSEISEAIAHHYQAVRLHPLPQHN